jgi:hypothetical protein
MDKEEEEEEEEENQTQHNQALRRINVQTESVTTTHQDITHTGNLT